MPFSLIDIPNTKEQEIIDVFREVTTRLRRNIKYAKSDLSTDSPDLTLGEELSAKMLQDLTAARTFLKL